MNVAILGASGAIGSMLTQHLLDTTDYHLTLFSHHAKQLEYDKDHRLTQIDGDVQNYEDVVTAVSNCEVVVYAIHLMGNAEVGRDFESAETKAVQNVIKALDTKLQRIIYISGVGNELDSGTRHLKSRYNTGQILYKNVDNVLEFRVPLVVGRNAAGFEVIRMLVDRLPVIPFPSWATGTTQPITVHDTVIYITTAITANESGKHVVEIGGPEVMSYRQIFERYVAFTGKRTRIIDTPFLPLPLVRMFFRLFKKNASFSTAADMLDSSMHSYGTTKPVPDALKQIELEKIENGFY